MKRVSYLHFKEHFLKECSAVYALCKYCKSLIKKEKLEDHKLNQCEAHVITKGYLTTIRSEVNCLEWLGNQLTVSNNEYLMQMPASHRNQLLMSCCEVMSKVVGIVLSGKPHQGTIYSTEQENIDQSSTSSGI